MTAVLEQPLEGAARISACQGKWSAKPIDTVPGPRKSQFDKGEKLHGQEPDTC